MSALKESEFYPNQLNVGDVIVYVSEGQVTHRALVIGNNAGYKISLQMIDEDGTITPRTRDVPADRLVNWQFDPFSTRLMSLIRSGKEAMYA